MLVKSIKPSSRVFEEVISLSDTMSLSYVHLLDIMWYFYGRSIQYKYNS